MNNIKRLKKLFFLTMEYNNWYRGVLITSYTETSIRGFEAAKSKQEFKDFLLLFGELERREGENLADSLELLQNECSIEIYIEEILVGNYSNFMKIRLLNTDQIVLGEMKIRPCHPGSYANSGTAVYNVGEIIDILVRAYIV